MTTLTEAPLSSTTHQTCAAELVVEYWTVGMDGQDACVSCDQTLNVLDQAVDIIRPIAERLGITVNVRPRTITTWTEALDHGIVASPTIRVAGIELRPTHPDDSEARQWTWRGDATPAVASEAVLDILIRALAARSEQIGHYLSSGGPAPYVRQFLQGDHPATQEPESASCGCATTCE